MQVRELQARLELLVDTVLKRQRSVIEPARNLARYNLVEQDRFITSVDRISLANPELAFHFCHQAIPALAVLDDTAWDPWVDELLKTFRVKGLEASIASLEGYSTYQEARAPASGSVAFTDIARVLESFIHALNGRALKLATAEQSFTDTETVYLPSRISHYPTRDENFRLYKALLVHQWAQNWFGTWRADITESTSNYPDPARARRLFHLLETLRLDACLERELPGMAREMAMLRPTNQLPHSRWQEAQAELQKANADVRTSIAWLTKLYALDFEPDSAPYQGQLHTEKTAAAIAERGKREHEALQEKLSHLRKAISDQPGRPAGKANEDRTGFKVRQESDSTATDDIRTMLEYQGADVEIDPQLQDLMDSILQDYGEIPDHYLDAFEEDAVSDEPEPDGVLAETGDRDTHDFSYDEWDHTRQRYRRSWCLLHEQSVTPVPGFFVDATLTKYHGILKHLRRSFEALRQEDRRLKREPFGDDIDIDASVEAWSDIHNGLEASKNLFIQTRRQERNVAVMFMVDMSASTAGWINRVERESLVLLCEALERLGDRYAIYGFSGRGNRHCQSFHIKDFDERYNDEVRNRIEGIQPQDYTRMGAAIRHLGARLNRIEARTRLLITLSDGRPDDVDGYRGHYGIEDTRKALLEMRQSGIHPFCITIDRNALDYLPHMFGRNSFVVINEVDKLPYRIGDIYSRLTT